MKGKFGSIFLLIIIIAIIGKCSKNDSDDKQEKPSVTHLSSNDSSVIKEHLMRIQLWLDENNANPKKGRLQFANICGMAANYQQSSYDVYNAAKIAASCFDKAYDNITNNFSFLTLDDITTPDSVKQQASEAINYAQNYYSLGKDAFNSIKEMMDENQGQFSHMDDFKNSLNLADQSWNQATIQIALLTVEFIPTEKEQNSIKARLQSHK